MTRNIMIDIETLGTSSNASILSIGACEFTLNDDGTGKIGDTFYVTIEPDGRHIDPDTVRWWLRQSKDAQDALFIPEPVSLKTAQNKLKLFIQGPIINKLKKPDGVWANGAMFDLNILRDCYGGYPPWRYSQECCMRSLRLLGGMHKGLSYSDFFDKEDTNHNALNDAIRQANYVIAFHGGMKT